MIKWNECGGEAERAERETMRMHDRAMAVIAVIALIVLVLDLTFWRGEQEDPPTRALCETDSGCAEMFPGTDGGPEPR